jgi:coproporphyrinogen III oxidase
MGDKAWQDIRKWNDDVHVVRTKQYKKGVGDVFEDDVHVVV